jgi:hypothetical protein
VAKPSADPRWANVGGAIVVPASGKLDIGFVTSEKPPSEWFNWLFNLIYQWILYFKNATTYIESISPALGYNLTAFALDPATASHLNCAAATVGSAHFVLPVKRGWMLTNVRVWCRNTSGGAGTITATLTRFNYVAASASFTGPVTLVGPISSSSATTVQAITLGAAHTFPTANVDILILRVQATNSAGTKEIFAIECDWDMP